MTARLVRLEVCAFRGFGQATSFDLDAPLTVLIGDNGQGKSSTLQAIEWALFGRDIEKKSTGIAERADWEVAHRGAKDRTEVSLVFATKKGEVTLTRQRGPGAAGRAAEVLRVAPAGGRSVEGEAAEAWVRQSGLPDWDTWRRAFCQHQENARQRLVESGDRTSVLAELLGLASYERLRDLLDQVKPAKLLAELDATLDRLDADAQRRLEAPDDEIFECERRLEALGLDRARLGPTLSLDLARELVERGRALAGQVGVVTPLPECESEVDVPQVGRWAQTWPSEIRTRARLSERLKESARRQATLAAAVDALQPLEARHKEARERRRKLEAERGDAATLQSQLASAQQRLDAARDRLQREDARAALWRQARPLLVDEACPVCGSHQPELLARLDLALATPAVAPLRDELTQAQARLEALRRAQHDLEAVLGEEAQAARAIERNRDQLAGLVPAGRQAKDAEPIAAARAELDAAARRAKELEAAIGELDAALEVHRTGVERLREVDRWRRLARRAERRTDVTAAAAWPDLERALDRASGLAADVEALAGLVRQAQEETSRQRTQEVNRYLEAVLGEITGAATARGVRVRVKRTGTKLGYDLEDQDERRVLPVLNQAALDALALALLFAQGTARARASLPAFLVLDDPGQSLDQSAQRGLARALLRVAQHVPVVVAAPPGPLSQALVEAESPRRRVVRFAPPGPDGVRIDASEARP